MCETKLCPKYGRELPTSEFHKSNRSNDGLQTYCKECMAECNKVYHRRVKAADNLPANLTPVTKLKSDDKIEILMNNYTARELMVALKMLGYKWTDMVIEQRVSYNNI